MPALRGAIGVAYPYFVRRRSASFSMSSLRFELRRLRGTWMGSKPRARVGRRRKGRAKARGAMVEGERKEVDLSSRNKGEKGVESSWLCHSSGQVCKKERKQLRSSDRTRPSHHLLISSSSIGPLRLSAAASGSAPVCYFQHNTAKNTRSMPPTYGNLHRDSRSTYTDHPSFSLLLLSVNSVLVSQLLLALLALPQTLRFDAQCAWIK
jgi:hypothetical protein